MATRARLVTLASCVVYPTLPRYGTDLIIPQLAASIEASRQRLVLIKCDDLSQLSCRLATRAARGLLKAPPRHRNTTQVAAKSFKNSRTSRGKSLYVPFEPNHLTSASLCIRTKMKPVCRFMANPALSVSQAWGRQTLTAR